MHTGYSNDNNSLLRVSDSLFLVGRGIALMYESVMWEFGIVEGDIISVAGRRKTLTICYSTNYSPFISTASLEQSKPEKEQWSYDPDKCITVSLSDEVYKKIVFEVEDKNSVTKMIEDAIKRQTKG